jgi:hypothetical protein
LSLTFQGEKQMSKISAFGLSALLVVALQASVATAGVTGDSDVFNSGNGTAVQARCVTGHDSPSDYDLYYLIYVACTFEPASYDGGNLAGFSVSSQSLQVASGWLTTSPWTFYPVDGHHVLAGANNDETTSSGSCATAAWGACLF